MREEPLMVGLAQRAPLPIGASLGEFARDVEDTLRVHPEIGLLVYPELHLCGSEHLPEEERASALEAAALPLDVDWIQQIGAIAAEHGIWLCPGSVGERGDDNGYYNTQLLFDPDGVLRARYRKIFPWRPFEPHDIGTEFVVEPLTQGGHAGLSICYDIWFPEHGRQLAWLGADLVLNIVKTTTPDREHELVLVRANAIMNQQMVVSVNCAAPVGRGRSLAVDAEGYVLGEAGLGPQTLIVPFRPSAVAGVREAGTLGRNRLWHQFRPYDPEVPLPMYQGRIDPRSWRPRSDDLPPQAADSTPDL